jgi:hypothetical protein
MKRLAVFSVFGIAAVWLAVSAVYAFHAAANGGMGDTAPSLAVTIGVVVCAVGAMLGFVAWKLRPWKRRSARHPSGSQIEPGA